MKTLVLKRPVIAVAGSSGKTTTKEMMASILKQRWRVYKSGKNRNDRAYMRKHCLSIKSYHRAAVLEYGMHARGNLRRSCRIIQPNMAILTMIGTAHIGNFGGSLPALIKAKSDIIEHMKPTGTLFINADDANSQSLIYGKFKGKMIRIGIENKADYQANNVAFAGRGMKFAVDLHGTTQQFFIPIPGKHNVYNALFAISVADQLGFTPGQIKNGLAKYHRPAHRLRSYHLKKGTRLIDDTYNANPHSMKAAIDVLANIGKGRTIAVLGNMSELGRYSIEGHRGVGQHLASHQIHGLFTYGAKAKRIGTTAIVHGYPPNKVQHSSSREDLHRRLRGVIGRETTILVKGSHDQHMNKTIRFLKRIG